MTASKSLGTMTEVPIFNFDYGAYKTIGRVQMYLFLRQLTEYKCASLAERRKILTRITVTYLPQISHKYLSVLDYNKW
ncbi:MAG: hypothetical protein V4736_15055 [Bdellovibrionota bacterium]